MDRNTDWRVKNGKRQLNVPLDRDLYATAKATAEERGVSLTGFISDLIRAEAHTDETEAALTARSRGRTQCVAVARPSLRHSLG